MINDLGWRGIADNRWRDTHLKLFVMIANHQVNVTFEHILILATGGTRKCHTHNKCMHIWSNIDDYKYSVYPCIEPSQNGINIQTLLSKLQVLTSFKNWFKGDSSYQCLNAAVHILHQHFIIIKVIKRFCWLAIEIQIQNHDIGNNLVFWTSHFIFIPSILHFSTEY